MKKFSLSLEQIGELLKDQKGTGGFQSLMNMIKNKPATIEFTDDEMDRLTKYANEYGQGGWQDKLKNIFFKKD